MEIIIGILCFAIVFLLLAIQNLQVQINELEFDLRETRKEFQKEKEYKQILKG
jgi:hypothetical protein